MFVGVVVVVDNIVIGEGWNIFISDYDLFVYVEFKVIRMVVGNCVNYWVIDVIFYVMLEFCLMCVGVLVYSCIFWVVFGVFDEKIGVVGSVM